MKKKKLTILVLVCSTILFSVLAFADLEGANKPKKPIFPRAGGPYYVYFDGYCNVLEIRIDTDGTAYGQEISCSTQPTIGGAKRTGGVSLGYEFLDDPRIYSLDIPSKTWEILLNSGTSLTYFASGSWHLGPAPLSPREGLPNAND